MRRMHGRKNDKRAGSARSSWQRAITFSFSLRLFKTGFSLASLSFAMEKPKLPSIKLMLEGLSGREEQEGNVRWI